MREKRKVDWPAILVKYKVEVSASSVGVDLLLQDVHVKLLHEAVDELLLLLEEPVQYLLPADHSTPRKIREAKYKQFIKQQGNDSPFFNYIREKWLKFLHWPFLPIFEPLKNLIVELVLLFELLKVLVKVFVEKVVSGTDWKKSKKC